MNETLHTAVRNLAWLHELESVRAMLRAQGIELLYLKGAAFLDTLYEDLGERPMVDLDVLVRPTQRSAAGALLEARGYRRLSVEARPVTRDEHYEWVYAREGNASQVGVIVELHAALCQPQRFHVDTEGLWRRATSYNTSQRVVPTLDPVDSLLYVALHEALHSYIIDERSLEDLRRIIARWQPHWPTVIDRARRWRMGVCLYISLAASRRRRGAEVPDWVLDALRLSPARRLLAGVVVDIAASGRSRFERWSRSVQLATIVATMDRPIDSLRFLAAYGGLRVRDALTLVRSRYGAEPNL